MENLGLYNLVREVPDEAQKQINAGRLKGFTDINPMWRIKVLTEQFGPCGIGWWYTIEKQWLESSETGKVAAFCNINLFYKFNGEVSQPIPGTGGSAFVENERSGKHVSDECYKMALTDAISVAAKAIGVGADIYWQKDKTKYEAKEDQFKKENINKIDQKALIVLMSKAFGSSENAKKNFRDFTGFDKSSDITNQEYGFIMQRLEEKIKHANEQSQVVNG